MDSKQSNEYSLFIEKTVFDFLETLHLELWKDKNENSVMLLEDSFETNHNENQMNYDDNNENTTYFLQMAYTMIFTLSNVLSIEIFFFKI